jgi:hypothetical protein
MELKTHSLEKKVNKYHKKYSSLAYECLKINTLSKTDCLSINKKTDSNVNRQFVTLVTKACYRTHIISDMYTYTLHINITNIVTSA